MICIASSTGVIVRWKRSESPARTPSGSPTRSERPTAASMSESVCMLSTQSPLAANVAKAASAQIPARAPPNRRETATPATVTPTQVIQSSRSSNRVTRPSSMFANPLKARMTRLGLSALRWSTSQVWKSFRCVGSVFQVSEAGHGYSLFQPRYASHMTPTMTATWTSFPRHQGACETTGTARGASVIVDTG